MNVYKIDKIADLLKDNTYPGRGIINGKSSTEFAPSDVQFPVAAEGHRQ